MKVHCDKITMTPVSELNVNTKNTNKHSKKQIALIAKSIRLHGFRQPILVGNFTDTIIAGEGRYLAARDVLKLSEVPVMLQFFDSELAEYKYLEADNNTTKNSVWDDDSFKLNLAKFNIDGSIFDGEEFGLLDFNISNVFGDDSEEEKDDKVLDIETNKHGVVKGDIWQLGKHRMMCGDATSKKDVMALMCGELLDLVHTDPPYNIGYKGTQAFERKEIENDNLCGDDFEVFLSKVYENYNLSMKLGAAIYVWHGALNMLSFLPSFLKAGFLFKSYIIWNKHHFSFGRSDYHYKHEPALYGWKDGGSHRWFGDRKQTTVWDVDRPLASPLHPTMKPLELCEKAILNSSKATMSVGDFFLGSGSTLIACEKNNRKCYGMEIDEHYCSVVIERWELFTGKKAKKLTK